MTVSKKQPLRMASVGLGNWAGRVVDLMLRHGASPDPQAQLVAVFEPNLSQHVEHAELLKTRGVKLVGAFDDVLNDASIDAVFLPVPIHLHRPLTERALAAGKAVLVEKPAAGCLQDVDAMIAARQVANRPVLVSFQDTYDNDVLRVKQAILSGAIGELQSASVLGCWPRGISYYQRTSWAGKIRHAGAWVLDSPVTNAFAHYLHLLFFLLGKTESEWAQPSSVEAELYRANDIENYDTTAHRYTVNGIAALAVFTHACREWIGPHIHLRGSRGHVQIDLGARIATIESGSSSEVIPLVADARELALTAFANHVRGIPTRAPLSTLEAARVHVLATNGASQAARVVAVPRECLLRMSDPVEGAGWAIDGIERALISCAATGQMLHEAGHVGWSTPAGRLDLTGYTRFTGCPEAIVSIDCGGERLAHARDRADLAQHLRDNSEVASDA